MAEPVMCFHVFADASQITDLVCDYGAATMIPFEATVESDLFCGKTVPGGCDVQIENPAFTRNLCAKYMFTGRDYKGNPCKLFVENNGYLTPVMKTDSIIHAFPRFLTDSPVLGDYLCRQQFRSEVQAKEDYLEIRIYDIKKEKN